MRYWLLLWLLTVSTWACLNVYEHNLDGKEIPTGGRGPEGAYLPRHDLAEWKERLQRLSRPNTLEQRNDRAVALVHLGRAREALGVFQQIEREAPGRYQTATNLGTCYELCGDDWQALNWIREGIARNPNSHGGTEWLHVRILEAKLALADDPNWLRTHTVLGYDFGSKPRPTWPTQLANPADRKRVRLALERQLHERAPLVPPPDPIVGDLLFALANVRALDSSVETGQAWLEHAIRYKTPQMALARQRAAFFDKFIEKPEDSSDGKKSAQKPKKRSASKSEPFWRTAWFRSTLAVIALLAGLLLLQRKRTR